MLKRASARAPPTPPFSVNLMRGAKPKNPMETQKTLSKRAKSVDPGRALIPWTSSVSEGRDGTRRGEGDYPSASNRNHIPRKSVSRIQPAAAGTTPRSE